MKSPQPRPNFFIAGAAKAGTTSLWRYLSQHPEIFMPATEDQKEPGFFCDGYGMKDYDAYLRIFEGAGDARAIGEASTAYLTSPESASRIRAAYPGARIIIILRNPADRAFSLYNWMIREGYEWASTFEKALELEENRFGDEDFRRRNPQYYPNYLYFHSGLYSNQVKNYVDAFPRGQLLFLRFDDLKREPVRSAQTAYEFLGVDRSFAPEIGIFNPTRVPYSPRVQYLARRLTERLSWYRIPALGRLRGAIFSGNLALGAGKPAKMQPATRNSLLKRYAEDIRETARLTGLDLETWPAAEDG